MELNYDGQRRGLVGADEITKTPDSPVTVPCPSCGRGELTIMRESELLAYASKQYHRRGLSTGDEGPVF